MHKKKKDHINTSLYILVQEMLILKYYLLEHIILFSFHLTEEETSAVGTEFYTVYTHIYSYVQLIDLMKDELNRLIIGSIAGQVVATSNIGRLLVLHSFEFRAVGDPVSEAAAVAATAFICKRETLIN